MTIEKYLQTLRASRRAGVPIVAIETPDPAATIDLLAGKVLADDTPIVVWDGVRGWTPRNEAGIAAINNVVETIAPGASADPGELTRTPIESLSAALSLPERSVLFMCGAHRVVDLATGTNAAAAQAVWNVRDPFKGSRRTLVLLGPSFSLPPELQNDIMLLDEPLPADEDLEKIIRELCEGAPEEPIRLEPSMLSRAVDAVRGLAAFPAEQAVAMSINGTLEVEKLWERKRRMISDTRGLAYWSGRETLDDVGGNANIKSRIREILRAGYRVIVFIDELDKMMQGAVGPVGDNTGVAAGLLQQKLVYMEDTAADGMLFIGPPGAGKSAVAKAIGNEAGIPTIVLDFGAMKTSLLGASEAAARAAFKVITAVGGGRALFVATCNRIASMPPELLRRYTMGTFIFDLPDTEEQEAIWRIYERAYALDPSKHGPRPDCSNWTGAEIRTCSRMASKLGTTLERESKYIVPVAKSAAAEIVALRRSAVGRYVSASYEGFYREPNPTTDAIKSGTRRVMAEKTEVN